MFEIATLIPTHNRLRNVGRLDTMRLFVRYGGRFTLDACLAFNVATCERPDVAKIHLALLPDGRVFVHDGHHRLVALLLGDHKYVNPSEYSLNEYSYEDYSQPNFENGWYTPFDLNTEVRLPDFFAFKNMMKSLKTDEVRKEMIAARRGRYAEPRKIQTMGELAKCVSNGTCIM